MLRKRREFWGLFVPFLALLALALFNSLATAFSPVDAVDNEDTIAGLVDVSMIINPAITTAGEEVVLEIRATNRGTVVANIVIDSAVPNSVTYDTRHIPASTTFNFQTNTFSWQPSIPAGETRTFTLPLRAAVADIANPFSTIEATYRYGLISDQLSAEFWVGVLPTAEILGNTDISVGQPLQLFADISGPGPFSQHWDLGDGRNFRADDPTLSYARAGDYDVVLEVSNPLGSVKTTRTITIKPDPVALFSLDDPTPAIDQEITFLNQSGGEGPLEFEWDFGDGVKAFIRQPIHQFETIGQHAVTLTVTNKFGSSTTAQPITVGEAPQMELILPSDAVMGEPLLGLVRSDDDSAEFSWDMGDGHIVDGNKLRYTYTRAGNYQVALTASNAYGSTQIVRQMLVEQGTLYLYLPVIYMAGQNTTQPTSVQTNQPAILNSSQPDYFSTFVEIDLEEDSVPFESSPEQRLLWYINKARQKVGLPPYQYNDALSQAAKRHTNDMAFQRFWGHTGSDGSRPNERQADAGYTGGYGGEATAWGFEYPSGAVGFWLESKSHRPLILNPNADQVGVAFTYDETSGSIYYWTAEFGRADGSYAYPFYQPAPAPTPTPAPLAVATATPQPPIATAPPSATPEIDVQPSPTPASATLEPTVTPTPEPLIVSEPTATQPALVQPSATPAATATPQATATITATTAATATATATPEPTITPTPQPTATPTALPTVALIVTATPTPIPTATPAPSPTPVEESSDSEREPDLIVTATPTAQPADNGASKAVTEQFLQAIIRDPEGYAALPFATYAMQNSLLNEGTLAALKIESPLTAFVLGNVTTNNDGTVTISAELTLTNNTQQTRALTLHFIENQWRVDSAEK